jgi:[ribosomal protein S5]-alanine N-acetyltransferase
MHISLQSLTPQDATRFASLANNINVAKYLTNKFPHPYTLEHATSFIEMATTTNTAIIKGIFANGDLVGVCGAHKQDDVLALNAELGYWIAEPYWGKGIASKAIGLMVPIAFNNLPINYIIARVFANNPASKKVLLKNGFTQLYFRQASIIKLGEVLDEYLFEIKNPSI